MNVAVINGLLTVVNSLISLSANSAKLRNVTSQAVAEGRPLSYLELQMFQDDAQSAIDAARADD